MCDIELKENISDLMRDTFIDVLSEILIHLIY